MLVLACAAILLGPSTDVDKLQAIQGHKVLMETEDAFLRCRMWNPNVHSFLPAKATGENIRALVEEAHTAHEKRHCYNFSM